MRPRDALVTLAAYALALASATVLALHDKIPAWLLAGLLGVAVPSPLRALRALNKEDPNA